MNDGNIEFLGRIDDQIKINGYRVELGEIESAVKQCCDAEEAVAVAVNEDTTYTAVFIKGENLTDIADELKKRLPEYMIPAVISFTDEIPLSSNGKVDRKKLAEKAVEIYASEENSTEKKIVPPETETEKKLCEIWSDVLNHKNISVQDHFFDAGGNSIQVIYLINAVNEVFGIDIGVSEFFEHPEIKSLAEYIDKNI